MKTMISASRKQFRQSAFAVTRYLWPPTYRGATEHLETEDDMAAYLEAALEENDPSYKALSPEGNPEFATEVNVAGLPLAALRAA